MTPTPETEGLASHDAGSPPRTDASSNDRAASDPVARLLADDAADEASLDRAVDEALAGLSEADRTGATAPTPTDGAMTVGAVVTGRVANVGSQDLLIDFGGKKLGTMQLTELDAGERYAVGESIEVLIVADEPRSGLVQVSRRQAKQAVVLRDLKAGMVLEGTITGMNKGGLDMDIHGLRGFIPASQVDLHFMKDISDLIGQHVRAEVTKFDVQDKNIVLSRRKVQLREAEENKQKAFTELRVGETRRGVVRALADYGAFVDVGGVDGLLHISDMSWGRVQKADDVVKVGDEIEVKVLKLDEKKKKVSLGLKQVLPDPWTNAAEKYAPQTRLTGRVVRLEKFGAFVELEPGVDGLLPLSELSWTRRVRHPSEIVKEGDVIEVAVLSADAEQRRISLGLKQLSEDPWATIEQRYPAGSTVKGKVVRTTEFGAFVSLEEGIDGLIHISELAEGRVKAVTDKVKPGDEVEVRVLSADKEAKRISLSLRPAASEAPAPDSRAAAAHPAPRKAPSKPRRGGLTMDWVQGLASLDPSKFGR